MWRKNVTVNVAKFNGTSGDLQDFGDLDPLAHLLNQHLAHREY